MKVLAFGSAALAMAVAGASVSPDNLSAQEIDQDMLPLPGQYQADVSLISVDMPGAPPEMAAMMGQMMGRKFNYCLTEEEVEKGFQAIMNRTLDGECAYARFIAVDGKIDAEMTCKDDGRDMTMVMQGTGSPTSSDITITMSGEMGMGPGTIKLRTIHNRVGGCS